MTEDDRITKLAKQIKDDIKRDQYLLLTEAQVNDLRREGASALHSICVSFVAAVNRRLTMPVLELTPPVFTSDLFREPGVNLVQINAQGRIVQIAFEATREKFSTEKFRIPYVLEGEIRAYNQECWSEPRLVAKRYSSV